MKYFIIAIITYFYCTQLTAQKKGEYLISINSGINNTTISSGMKGMFIQGSVSKCLAKPINLRLTIGMSKSSDFPKKFSYLLRPFILADTMYGFNLDMWNAVKHNTRNNIVFNGFTQATNMYVAANADITFFNIRKFSFGGTIGVNLVSTFGTMLYPDVTQFNADGNVIAFTPVAYYHKNVGLGFNTGLKIAFQPNANWVFSINADKFFGERFTHPEGYGAANGYAKSEWINIGLGVSKTFKLKKKNNKN